MSPIAGLIQTLILMALIFVLCYKFINVRTKNSHFECPVCGTSFKLSKIGFAFALKRNLYERMVTCPVCNNKGWMPILNDD